MVRRCPPLLTKSRKKSIINRLIFNIYHSLFHLKAAIYNRNSDPFCTPHVTNRTVRRSILNKLPTKLNTYAYSNNKFKEIKNNLKQLKYKTQTYKTQTQLNKTQTQTDKTQTYKP